MRETTFTELRNHAKIDTGLFFGCRDLDSAYAYLRTQGIDLEKPKVAPYGMKQLWFADPDGYIICPQWPAG